MGRTLLAWNRTDTGGQAAYDYTGLDLDRPRLYARVYLSSLSSADRQWSWFLSETTMIAAGEKPTLEEALAAVEGIYATWRKSQERR